MKISIIGTGHVGLVSGACFAERGHKVRCIDSDAAKIKTLQSGKMPIYEPGLAALVKKNVRAKRLSFGGNIRDAVAHGKVIFMCVPTPPQEDGTADLSYVESVARDIASLQVITSPEIKHTEQDTAEWVPAVGLEQIARAYAKIIDGVNTLDRNALQSESAGL